MKRLFFLGSLTPPDECRKNPYCSEAANNAQLGMLRGLMQCGVEQVIGVCPVVLPSFPRSDRLWIGASSHQIDPSLLVIAPGFVNFGAVRVLTRILSVITWLLNLRRKYGKPDVILTYNLDPGYALAGYLIAKLWRIPVVPIVADLSLPEALKPSLRGYNARLQVALLKRVTGVVTFSSLTARDLQLTQPVIKVEPGVNAIDFLTLPSFEPEPQGRKIVMFSGTLVEASGILWLLEAFSLVRDPDVELWITGRGDLQARIEEAAKHDSRIRFIGFVDRSELLRLYAHATVLINPRQSSLPEHRYNFPSKLLQYMATGRPVITTATGDVAEYESLVFLLHEETATAMARLISEVCALSPEEREARATQARAYVLRHKTWEVESRRIYEFLRSLASSK